MKFQVSKSREILDQLRNYELLKKDYVPLGWLVD
jgi:hypothetical protein